MENRIQLPKFVGNSYDDAERFINTFEAFCVFNKLDGNDQRKVAAFQLHIDGPALVWFNALDSVQKKKVAVRGV